MDQLSDKPKIRLGYLLFISFQFLVLLVTDAQSQSAPDVKSPLKFDVSLRSRYELADWYGGLTTDRQYSFGHTKLQFGAEYLTEPVRFYVQGQHTQLYGLPDNATGPGSVYYVTNGSEDNPGDISLRQGLIELKQDSFQATAGRFLYSNGSEAMPKQATLAAVRTKRVAQRVIGPFDFTAGRSFDGGRGNFSSDIGTLFGMFSMPTQGGFETDLNQTIDDIKLGAMSWTAPFSQEADATDDLQLFAYSYYDDRNVVKPDSRPLDIRTADTSEIQIGSLGGHYTRLINTGDYPVDALFWGVWQFGDWGEQDHAAWAFTTEIGARAETISWKPGVRVGYTYGSGDDDPTDNDHETFFQILPTARAYAATPFYNMMNSGDLFMQIHSQPLTELSLKSELHWLQLADSNDLFYVGAGANERRNRFGYSGSASGGAHDIGLLLDAEATWSFNKFAALTAYYGHLFGGDVVDAASQGGDDDIDYFFLELMLKYS